MLFFRYCLSIAFGAIAAGNYSLVASAQDVSSTEQNPDRSETELMVEVVDRTDGKITATEESIAQANSEPNNSRARENLQPNQANPLLLPTKVDEVQIDNVQAITLRQALEIALRNNEDLSLAQLSLERSQEQLKEALGAEFPTLATQFDFDRTDSANSEISLARAEERGTSLLDDDTVTSSLSARLELSYNLYTGGRRSAQIRATERQVRFNQLDLERIAEQTLFDVTNDYYSLQDADAQVRIEQAAIEDASQSLRDAELLEQAGLGTKFDVLRAQVELSNAQQRLILAFANQKTARRQLVERIGLEQNAEITAADPIEVAGTWDLSLEKTILLAYKNRAELEQFLVQREIDQQQQQLELATIRPQISLFANYDVLEVLDDEVGAADGFSLGARIRWTFFDGGVAKARSAQEEVDEEIAETRFADQQKQIRLEVETAYFGIQANRQNIDTASKAVELAEESLRLARLRFQAGVGTQTEVIDAQTELTTARGNLLSAIISYNQQLAALRRSVTNIPDGLLFDAPR